MIPTQRKLVLALVATLTMLVTPALAQQPYYYGPPADPVPVPQTRCYTDQNNRVWCEQPTQSTYNNSYQSTNNNYRRNDGRDARIVANTFYALGNIAGVVANENDRSYYGYNNYNYNGYYNNYNYNQGYYSYPNNYPYQNIGDGGLAGMLLGPNPHPTFGCTFTSPPRC